MRDRTDPSGFPPRPGLYPWSLVCGRNDAIFSRGRALICVGRQSGLADRQVMLKEKLRVQCNGCTVWIDTVAACGGGEAAFAIDPADLAFLTSRAKAAAKLWCSLQPPPYGYVRHKCSVHETSFNFRNYSVCSSRSPLLKAVAPTSSSPRNELSMLCHTVKTTFGGSGSSTVHRTRSSASRSASTSQLLPSSAGSSRRVSVKS